MSRRYCAAATSRSTCSSRRCGWPGIEGESDGASDLERGPGTDWPCRLRGGRGDHAVGRDGGGSGEDEPRRSEEHTSELQSLMRISYAVFCLKKKTTNNTSHTDKPEQQ